MYVRLYVFMQQIRINNINIIWFHVNGSSCLLIYMYVRSDVCAMFGVTFLCNKSGKSCTDLDIMRRTCVTNVEKYCVSFRSNTIKKKYWTLQKISRKNISKSEGNLRIWEQIQDLRSEIWKSRSKISTKKKEKSQTI